MNKNKILVVSLGVLVLILLTTTGQLTNLKDKLLGLSLSGLDANAEQVAPETSRELIDSTGNSFGMTTEPAIQNDGSNIYIGSEEFLSQNDANGIIVQFKKDPALKARGLAIASQKSPVEIKNNTDIQRNSVREEHAQAQVAIEKILKKKLTDKGAKRRNDESIRIEKFSDSINGFVIYDVPVAETMAKLKDLPMVKDVQPNYTVKADLLTSVPQTKVDQVWQYASSGGNTLTGVGMKVGIIDTGVDYTHPSLGGCFGPTCKVSGGYDFVNNDSNPMDDNRHGTHVAGIVAGYGLVVPPGQSSSVSILGTAPDSTLYAFKALNSSGSGGTGDIISAIEACGDPNNDGDYSDSLDVCNMSLGGPGNPDDAMSTAVDNVTIATDVLFAISAGNSGPNSGTIGSPGTARRALTVAAACKPGQGCDIADFSSRGPVTWTSGGATQTLQKPDISAPGVQICAAKITDSSTSNCGEGYVTFSGTSMSSPHIAGIAAILRQAHPGFIASEIKDVIMQTATPYSGLAGTVQGTGLVNSLEAFTAMGIPSQVMQITGLPLIFVDNVTQGTQTFTKTISVKNISPTNFVVTPTFSTSQAGYTASFSPSSLSLAQGATGNITITQVVDHSIVSSPQKLVGTINLASSAGNVSVFSNIHVQRRLISDKSTVDLGFMTANNTSWTNSASIQLSNSITDLTSNYTTSVVCCTVNGASTSGVNVSLTPTPVSLQGGESRPYTLNVSIPNGSTVPNGLITGKLVLSSSLETLEIPFSFYKGYNIKLNFANDIVNSGQYTTVTMYNNNTNYTFRANNPATNVYMTDPTTFSFFLDKIGANTIGKGVGSSNSEINSFIFKQNISTSNVTPIQEVNFSLTTDATKKIQFSPTRPDGTASGLSGMVMGFYDSKHQKYLLDDLVMGVWSGASGYFTKDLQNTYINISNFDSNVKFLASAVSRSNSGNELATYQYQINQGLTTDMTFTNTVSDFGTKYLYAFPNHSIPSSSPKIIYPTICTKAPLSPFTQTAGAYFENKCINMSLVNTPFVNSNQPVIIKSIFEGDTAPDLTKAAFYPNTFFSIGTDPGQYMASPLYRTRSMLLTKDNIYTWRNLNTAEGNALAYSGWNYANTSIESAPENIIYLGAGPVYDSTKLENIGYSIKGAPFFGSANPLTSFGGTSSPWYMRDGSTDGALNIESNNVTYTLKRSGTTVSQGTISPAYPNSVYANGNMEFSLADSSGSPLELSLVSPVTINNVATENRTSFTFSMALSQWNPSLGVYVNSKDSRPPFIEKMHILGGGIWQHVIDNTKVNTLSFKVNPNQMPNYATVDAINTVSVQVSTNNGSTWTNIPVTGNLGTYDFIVPVSSGVSMYTFKITASDLANNTLTHQFQIPSGTHIVPPTSSGGGDTVPPTLGPLSVIGQTGTSVSGTVILGITATDTGTNATGVNKVQFYSGAVLLGTVHLPGSGDLYSIAFDSTIFPDGNRDFFAKAYDNATVQNISISENLTLNIQNGGSGGGDTIDPIIAFSSPSGSVLPKKGSVKITANASDSSGISSIVIKVNGVTLKTCSNATTCTYNWKMAGLSAGTYILEAVATDPSGNTGTVSKTMTKN